MIVHVISHAFMDTELNAMPCIAITMSGMEHQESATALGIQVVTLKMRIAKVINRMKTIMKPNR